MHFNKQVVGNSLKSLEVSEEKANQRVEEFKREMKTLSIKLKEAEQRAENAEKQVKRLQKEVDRLEGMFSFFPCQRRYSSFTLSSSAPNQCVSTSIYLSIYRCTLCAVYDIYIVNIARSSAASTNAKDKKHCKYVENISFNLLHCL